MVPGVDSKTYLNKTNDPFIWKIHTEEKGSDIKVLEYISNPSNKIHVDSAMKKLLSINAELLTTEKQEADSKFLIKSKKEFDTYRFIAINDLLKSKHIKAELRSLLETSIIFDTVESSDYIYLPNKLYTWQRTQNTTEWYEDSNLNNRKVIPVCFTTLDKTVLSYENVLEYSNNRPLKQEEFSRIVSLLNDESSQLIALDILNTINPTLSFIELMLAFNYIPEHMKKNKKKVLPLVQEIYGFRTDLGNFSLDRIILEYNRNFNIEATPEQLEFIADNYYNNMNETSSVFDFKLKLKKKW